MKSKRKFAAQAAGMGMAALLAAWFLYAPIASLVGKGPFDWHVRQPAAWQGGLEVLALAAVFYVALTVRTVRLALLIFLIAAWLYTRRHGVDFSVILIALYAEAVFAIGRALAAKAGFASVARPAHALAAGLAGVVAWSLMVWGCSWVGLGSIESIRFLTIAVLGIALIALPGPRASLLVWHSMRGRRAPERAVVALLAAFFLALFAKSSVLFDYDSMWYGLQAEEVLVGEGSIFAAQGLASVAHYYPKLYEALALPFAGLGSTSLPFGLGILSSAMVMLTGSAILREYGVRRSLRLIGAALVATLPALANIAMTAKGDAFSAWLLLMGALGLIKHAKGQGRGWLWISLAATALSVQARLSNLPYAAIMLAMQAWALAVGWRADGDARPVRFGAWILGAAFVLSVLITVRSVLLSGLVLVAPNSVVALQQSMGFELKYPVGILPPDSGLERLPPWDGLLGILFDPARFPHLVITWIGNVWMFLPIAILLLGISGARAARSRGGAWRLLLLGLAFFAVMFGYKLLVPAGDGNYFIVPIVSLTLWGIIQADRLRGAPRRVLEGVLVAFIASGAAISFVTGAWGPGTRGWDTTLSRLPLEYEQHARAAIAAAHMEGVEGYFNDVSPGARVIGIEAGSIDAIPAGWWLPVRYEAVQPYVWQQPQLVASPAAFEQYLRQARIEYVIMPHRVPAPGIEAMVAGVVGKLVAKAQAVEAFKDAHYVVWKLEKAPSLTSTALDGGGTAVVAVDEKRLCANSANEVATVTWSGASAGVAIEVGLQGGPGKLWAEAGTDGTLRTGPWVTKATEFHFRLGRMGRTIGRIVVSPRCA